MSEVRSESYQAVLKELGPRQQEVWGLLNQAPSGLTAWEIHSRTNRLVHSIRPRLCELKERGLVRECGKRWHSETGRNETVWVALVKPGELF